MSEQHPARPTDPVDFDSTEIDRRIMLRQAVAVFAVTLTGCGGDGEDSASAAVTSSPAAAPTPIVATCVAPPATTAPAVSARTAFVHPGLLSTEAGFERMRTRIAAGEQPWKSGADLLLADRWSYPLATPRPIQDVTRPGNVAQMFIDMQQTYVLAVAWKVTGDVKYADRAVIFLDTWSAAMKTLTGNADAYLAAGLYGYQWA